MTGLRHRFSERGVSESIGFILIFSIMIAGIGLVTLYGYPMLMQQQSNANEQIMEKNMIVLQNDVKSLVYKTVPYKESSLNVGGGALTVYNTSFTPAIFTINITDCGSPPTYYGTPFTSGDLRYSSNSAGTDISLQNGAVVLRPQVPAGSVNGSAMLAQPRWFYDNQTNTLVINLMSFNSTNLMSLAGIGTVGTALGVPNYTYANIPAGANSLCVAYTPYTGQDYSVAWDNYFMNTLNNPPDISVSRSGIPGTGSALTYKLTISRPLILVVKKYDVVVKSL
jgi:hypothetical protein